MKKGKTPSRIRQIQDILRALENPLLIAELSNEKTYRRLHDDHDGTGLGIITIFIGPDDDVWVRTDKDQHDSTLRFRHELGEGMSPRVRNALLILALAIKRDNEARPQYKKEGDS